MPEKVSIERTAIQWWPPRGVGPVRASNVSAQHLAELAIGEDNHEPAVGQRLFRQIQVLFCVASAVRLRLGVSGGTRQVHGLTDFGRERFDDTSLVLGEEGMILDILVAGFYQPRAELSGRVVSSAPRRPSIPSLSLMNVHCLRLTRIT